MDHSVRLVCGNAFDGLQVEVAHGQLVSATRKTDTEALIELSDVRLEAGAFATRVTVRLGEARAFTFFLRDVTTAAPIYIPSLSVAVLPAGDARSYGQVASDVAQRALLSQQQAMMAAPEHSFAAACGITRDQQCPTWLGLGRDIRMFRVSPYTAGHPGIHGYWGLIEPALHSLARDIPESLNSVRYGFVIGRGASCSVELKRWLEDGVLPILHSTQRDGEIEYRLVMFADLEFAPLAEGRVRGTHPTAALANTIGVSLTKEELSEYDGGLKQAELRAPDLEQVVCRMRVTAVNTGAVPRYAYFKAVRQEHAKCAFAEGCTSVADRGVIAVHQIGGAPMPQEEMAVLLQPGASMSWDLMVPHSPVAVERARKLATQSFEDHHAAARRSWENRLRSAARISVPESGISERIAAGLLHLDINTLGLAQEGRLLATVGWYSPIGSESSPMIQFYDSVGWHEQAERCIQFFLDRQRADGFIQTFGGYQLETGPALWTIGEHFRYTRDTQWAKRIQPAVAKSCDFILAWRKKNMRDELRAKGYGLLDGKVADPEDFFHSFMLNGLAYLGLKRIAEMYGEVDADFARTIARELDPYLSDIRTAFAENVAQSPAIPVGDGSWVPSFAPWAEYPGPVSLFAEGGNWFSHGIFSCRDTLIGALYLGIGEVLSPDEPLANWLLQAHQELMTYRNAGMSQPYYCRHDWLHLKRGEVKPFLHTYYNQLAALQDRETHTFWEHYYGVSQHKTHEEGWFLMQTRWMLWMEDFEAEILHLLPGVPRAWLKAGEELRLDGCVSYFGRFTLVVKSASDHIEVDFRLGGTGKVPSVDVRLPLGRTVDVAGMQKGLWDATREVLSLGPTREATLRLSLGSV